MGESYRWAGAECVSFVPMIHPYLAKTGCLTCLAILDSVALEICSHRRGLHADDGRQSTMTLHFRCQTCSPGMPKDPGDMSKCRDDDTQLTTLPA